MVELDKMTEILQWLFLYKTGSFSSKRSEAQSVKAEWQFIVRSFSGQIDGRNSALLRLTDKKGGAEAFTSS